MINPQRKDKRIMKNPKCIYENVCRDLEKEELRLNTLKKRDAIERSYNKILSLRRLVSDKEYWDNMYKEYIVQRAEHKSIKNGEYYRAHKEQYKKTNWCESQASETKAKNKCKELHNYTCQRCGRTVAETRIEGHHIIPIGVEGCTNEQSNLVCLCHKCHRNLHDYLRNNPTDKYYVFTENFIKNFEKSEK